MDISIVIPNYNGEQIIKKNIPRVANVFLQFLKKENKTGEIIINDDDSQDNSFQVMEKLKKDYSEGPLKIEILKNEKNYGFSTTVNRGVKKANGEIIILLNTDVIPKEGFIEPLVSDFKDDKVFAVGCMDESIEGDSVVLRGRGVGKWRRGFLVHSKGSLEKDNTLWVSGGSGAFNTKVWRELGGLNEIFNPFYWEDIDLSYRALKAGYKTKFQKKSVVVHEHETGAIKSKYSPFDVKVIAYRNQFIFVWTNADIIVLIQHLILLPYHIIRAALNFDSAFFLGLFKAIKILPSVISTRTNNFKKFIRTDREIIADFIS